MDDQWAEIADAIESSDPDRVNAVIDRIKSMDPDERARLFDVGFEELAGIYAGSDDGYVRQSTVRVTERLLPGMAAAFLLEDEEGAGGDAVEGMGDRIDAACGFLLDAIQDGDGRVRNSAKRALKDVYRSYDALEDGETIAALAAELDELAEEYSGKRREHVLDSKDDAEFFLQPHGARLLKGLERMAHRSKER
jgi:hypothetical protein